MAIEWFTTDIEYLKWILLAGLIALIISLFLEVKRSKSLKSLSFRIIATLLLVLSLITIMAKPAIKSLVESGKVLLLSPGYSNEMRDSLEVAVEETYFLDSITNAQKHHMLTNNEVFLIGEGLTLKDVTNYHNESIKYLEDTFTVEGIREIYYQKLLYQDDSLILKGVSNFSEKARLKLGLIDDYTDSLDLEPGKNTFKLKTKVEASGTFLLNLLTIVDGDSSLMQLPVTVKEKPVYKILMVNSFPTFELNYLNKYLSDEGHKVAVRNRITKGRFKYEFHNMNRIPLSRLDEAKISDFDLFIADYPSISMMDNKLLKKLVQEGLGIFVLPDNNLFEKNNLFIRFNFNVEAGENEIISINNSPFKIPVYTYRFSNEINDQTLYNGTVQIKRVGAGFAGTTSLADTYQLILNGESGAYKMLWSSILKNQWRTIKQSKVDYDIPAILNHPVEFEFTGFDKISHLKFNAVDVSYLQDPHLPNKYFASYWPDKQGWNRLNINNDTVPFYVSNPKIWHTKLLYDKYKANRRAFTENFDGAKSEMVEKSEVINPLWFYLLFMISAAYLWLEPKLR